MTLLRTKLHGPRPGDELVPRPLLLDTLEHGLTRPLTLISAPAGSGKTMLVAMWLQQRDGQAEPAPWRFAWLSLDENDNELALFLSYVVAALRTVFPNSCPRTQSLLEAPQLAPAHLLTTALINEIADLPEGVILVLDDYHQIRNEAIHQVLSALVTRGPAQLHVVLMTRVDPPLPLAALRAGRRVLEFRSQDLRFTAAETRELLERMEVAGVADETVRALEQRTEGWITGLQLAALSMQSATDREAFVSAFGGRDRHVAEYLVDEVLDRQPRVVQEFLLRTSILARFCAPLCDAVLEQESTTGYGRSMLDGLERANLFLVPLDTERQWYRYHHLFQEFLFHRLGLEHTWEKILLLHTKAGRWLAANGLIEEALRHMLAAGDVDGAARLVEQHFFVTLGREAWTEPKRWLELLPDQVKEERPKLLLCRAWVMHHQWDLGGGARVLAHVEALLDDAPELDSEARQELVGLSETLWSALDGFQGKGRQCLEHARRAMDALPFTHVYPRAIAMLCLGLGYPLTGQLAEGVQALHTALGEEQARRSPAIASRVLIGLVFAYLMAGEISRLVEIARHLVCLAAQERLPEATAWAEYGLGVAMYERNDLASAADHFAAVAQLCHRVHDKACHDSLLGLTLTRQAQGRPQEAHACLNAALEFALQTNNPHLLRDTHSFQARLALLQGDPAPALRWARSAGPESALSLLLSIELPGLTRSWALIVGEDEADLREAARLLEFYRGAASKTHCIRGMIMIAALQALAYDALGQPEDAMTALADAVSLAEPRGFVRTFVDIGTKMALLLRRLAARGVAAEYVVQVLASFPDIPASGRREDGDTVERVRQSVAEELPEPLTPREIEVLRLLAGRLSNQEIGERLFISPLTVKKHTSSLYRKLDAEGRREAVAQAITLGILPRR